MVCRSLKEWCHIFGILLHVLGGMTAHVVLRHACRGGGFYCSQDMKCIKSSHVCDYHQDCKDGEDEKNCGSCDFSRDTCGYADESDGRNVFKRSQSKQGVWNIPASDHTTKSEGYFMMTSPNRMQNQTTKSRCITSSVIDLMCVNEESLSVLESLKLPITSPNCMLSFSYYYHSNDSSMLEVGHKQLYQNGYIESILWRKELIPMTKWQQAAIGIGQRPHGWSLFFRTDQMYVAIDDIKLQSCSYPRPKWTCQANQARCGDGSCINSTQICDFSNDCMDGSDESRDRCKDYIDRCNFEEDFCHWSQSLTDDLDWSRRSGTVKGSPYVDHTLGTSRGVYSVLDASEHDEDKTAQLVSVVFEEGKNNCHMQLYFHIDGDGHTLSIKRRTTKGSKVRLELIETLSGQRNLWNHAVVNLTTEENFQVVIEAKIGQSREGVIAVDDISFCTGCKPEPPACKDKEFSCGDGQCVPCEENYCICDFVASCNNRADEKGCESSCDFEEENTCSWKNEFRKDSLMNWKVYQGYTPTNGTGPPYDHTKKTKKGHYVYVDGRQKDGGNFPLATFVSPVYNHGALNCKFTFWYNMHHEKVVDKNDAILRIIYRSRDKSGKVRKTSVWTDSNTTGIKWKQGVVELPPCPRQFNVIFQVQHYWNTQSDVALDDWKFDCSEKPPVSCNNQTEFQCTISKQCVPLDSICDLEHNCCDGSDENVNSCKGFTTIDFENDFEDGWVQLDNELFDFPFTLHQGKTLTDNTGPTYDHTFRDNDGKYIYTEATSRIQNQTAAMASPTIAATTANHSKSNTTCMVRFWYNMYGTGMGTLSIYTATTFGKPEKKLWNISGNQGTEWKKKSIELHSQYDFQVIFKATIGADSYSDLALDDISLTPGCILSSKTLRGKPTPSPRNKCLPGLYCRSKQKDVCIPQHEVCDFESDCDDGEDESEGVCGYPQGFEHGFGAWENDPDRAKYPIKFIIHKGPTPTKGTGPTTDASGNATGHYIYFETTDEPPPPHRALLVSPWYKSAYSGCKLNLFYHMYGKEIGAFIIRLVDENKETTDMLDIRGNMGNQWHEIDIVISRRREQFQIHLQTYGYMKGDKGDIAIDDINFLDCGRPPVCKTKNDYDQFRCQNNVCVPKSKVCDFVDDCGDSSDENPSTCSKYMGCNFDEHLQFCNFTHDVTGDFNWTINSGQTDSVNTGPTHDHTKRTSKGQYIYIEASGRKVGEKARIKSFHIIAHRNCRMKFYYHRFGSGLGDLNINVIVNDDTRVLRQKINDPSQFMWKEAVIDFSNETRVFRVEFEGTIGHNHEGDIAIDDIIFTPECLTPPNVTRLHFPTPIGCVGKFSCKSTGNCIPVNKKCNNGTFDCKDKSDEEGCDVNRTMRPRIANASYLTYTVSCLLIVVIITAVAAAILIRRGREKPYLFSIFYDPSAVQDTGHHVIKQSKKASTISSVSNPVYDNASDKSEKASIFQSSRPYVDNHFPVYQEPFYLSKPNLH